MNRHPHTWTRAPRRPTPTRRQAGVGLIEVMIAVLVLSIGFLGVGALLAMSLSTNNSAMSRSLATMDSYSIFDAMRADLVNAKGGAYNTATPLAGNACPASTGGTLAQNQLGQWCSQLATDLGNTATTTGSVNCSATGDCTVTIQFDDSRAGVSGAKTQKVVTEAIL
jgi:type IV pilus assembly protein PilV